MNLTDALTRITGAATDAARDRADAGAGLPLAAMVAEARRRRRRFAAAASVAGAAAVALVVVGGSAALGRIDADPVPPATPTTTTAPTPTASPSPTRVAWPAAPTVAAVPACGEQLPAVDTPADPRLWLVVTTPATAPVPADQHVEVQASFTGLAAADTYAHLTSGVTYVLARDGVVVAETTGWSPDQTDEPRRLFTTHPPTDHVLLPRCDPGQVTDWRDQLLAPGDYQLLAYARLAPAAVDGVVHGESPIVLAAEPVPLRLGDPLSTTEAAPELAPELPACGESTAGLSASPTTPLEVSADVRSTGPGSPMVQATLTNRSGAWFEQLDSGGSVAWVAAQDGTVVATGGWALSPEPTWLAPTDWESFGRNQPLEPCGAGGAISGPVQVWVQVRALVDLAPYLDNTDPWVAITAGPVTYGPAG